MDLAFDRLLFCGFKLESSDCVDSNSSTRSGGSGGGGGGGGSSSSGGGGGGGGGSSSSSSNNNHFGHIIDFDIVRIFFGTGGRIEISGSNVYEI
jgi:hypothetical protein